MARTSGRETSGLTEIADAIERESPDPIADLAELWRRVAFGVLISNTDDHLRNHGFLRHTSGGWSLAPAFDLNPNPAIGPKELSTAIDFENREARLDILFTVAPEFRLDPTSARKVFGEVVSATSTWRQVAARRGLSAEAQSQMAPAFEAQLAAALELAT